MRRSVNQIGMLFEEWMLAEGIKPSLMEAITLLRKDYTEQLDAVSPPIKQNGQLFQIVF